MGCLELGWRVIIGVCWVFGLYFGLVCVVGRMWVLCVLGLFFYEVLVVRLGREGESRGGVVGWVLVWEFLIK